MQLNSSNVITLSMSSRDTSIPPTDRATLIPRPSSMLKTFLQSLELRSIKIIFLSIKFILLLNFVHLVQDETFPLHVLDVTIHMFLRLVVSCLAKRLGTEPFRVYECDFY